MAVENPRITILGAGPAGIACAYALTKEGGAEVSVIERAPVAGGNAASFEAEGSGAISVRTGFTLLPTRMSWPM